MDNIEEYDEDISDFEDEPIDEIVGSDDEKNPDGDVPDMDSDMDSDDEVEYVPDIDDIADIKNNETKVTISKNIGSDCITPHRMTNFEFTRVLGDRATHLDNGASPNIDITGMTSSIEIAYHELIAKKIPMTISRRLGGRNVDILNVSDMDLPNHPPTTWIFPGY